MPKETPMDVLHDALSHLSGYVNAAKSQSIPLTLKDDDDSWSILEHALARVDEAYNLLEAAESRESMLDLVTAWKAAQSTERSLRDQIEARTGKSPEDFLSAMRELLS